MSLDVGGETTPRRDGECRAASDMVPSFFFFAKKVFRHPAHAGTNESERWKCSDFWLLAKPGHPIFAHLLPAFTSATDESAFGDWHWEVVSSYSSATASDSHGIPSNHSLTYNSQRTGAEATGEGECGKRKLAASCSYRTGFGAVRNSLNFFSASSAPPSSWEINVRAESTPRPCGKRRMYSRAVAIAFG